jgi:hypothetical protein
MDIVVDSFLHRRVSSKPVELLSVYCPGPVVRRYSLAKPLTSLVAIGTEALAPNQACAHLNTNFL